MGKEKKPGVWDKVSAAFAEPVIQTMVVEQITRYAGPKGDGLKIAICLNKDIYQLWIEEGEREGIPGLDEARRWTARAPTAWKFLTPDNIKRWLDEQGWHIYVDVIERTSGGDEWLDWTCKRFREGLWS